MTEHPITPPPELVREWLCSEDYPWGPLEQASVTITTNRLQNVATQAAQWGADQELEACVKLIEDWGYHPSVSEDFRAACRPPPNLKEQALEVLAELCEGFQPDLADLAVLRRALEALPE